MSAATASADLLRAFKFTHLEPEARAVARPFAALAMRLHLRAPHSEHTLTALRALLVAREAALQAVHPVSRSGS